MGPGPLVTLEPLVTTGINSTLKHSDINLCTHKEDVRHMQ